MRVPSALTGNFTVGRSGTPLMDIVVQLAGLMRPEDADYLLCACNSAHALYQACRAEEEAETHFNECEDCDQDDGIPCDAGEGLREHAQTLRRAALALAEGRSE